MKTTRMTATVRMDSGTYRIVADFTPASFSRGEPEDLEILSLTDAAGAELDFCDVAARERAVLGEPVCSDGVASVLCDALRPIEAEAA